MKLQVFGDSGDLAENSTLKALPDLETLQTVVVSGGSSLDESSGDYSLRSMRGPLTRNRIVQALGPRCPKI